MSDYLSKLFSLQGKVAAVMGGGGYLCGEMARAFAKTGAAVAIFDKNEKGLTEVRKDIEKSGGKVLMLSLDVTRPEDHQRALKAVLAKFKKVDILMNGAGINAPTPFFEITEDEWQAILDCHLKGTLLGCQIFGKHMVKQRKGSIINMSSASSGPPLSKAFTYSVAKAGIKSLTQNLAREWAPYHVRVNALRPGFFPTEWSKKNFLTPERTRAILNHTPMGRFGKPSELIGAVIWLCSDAASFVTGSEVAVDGGFSCMTI